ncbi:hypothetical protein [Amycolatopsis thermoflava]|uniref:hypothetical protein n=1 Tax=Amycolatopsis thermoflava TaxID=84480 RepID=UPI00040393A2|nr:hypothetical protein [Amycolatopsis thermoflava]
MQSEDSDLEFEFYLADRLGRTVAELRESLSQDEYVAWTVYFGRKAQRQELAMKSVKRGR